jgi:hypothetical protein
MCQSTFFPNIWEKGIRMYAPTIEDILKPYLQYPTAIQQAILMVDTNPRFLGLTRSMKAVLKTLLTRASKSDGTTPIRARLDTVAMQADVSTKTVQRTVATLDKAGWMTATTEGRTEHGVYTSRRYAFSNALCSIVGLPTKSRLAADLPGETKMSDGPIYVDLSFKKDHQEILSQNRKSNPTANPIVLPKSLRPIVEMGVKDTGVCKLRGLATAKGYDLADIFTVAKQHLANLKGDSDRIYRYLAAMIDNPKVSNYAARAAQIDRNNGETVAEASAKARRDKYRHKRFTLGNGIIVRVFDGIAEVTRDGTFVSNIAGRDMERVYDDIETGKLKEIPQ